MNQTLFVSDNEALIEISAMRRDKVDLPAAEEGEGGCPGARNPATVSI